MKAWVPPEYEKPLFDTFEKMHFSAELPTNFVGSGAIKNLCMANLFLIDNNRVDRGIF